jgi:hypothetical protein
VEADVTDQSIQNIGFYILLAGLPATFIVGLWAGLIFAVTGTICVFHKDLGL